MQLMAAVFSLSLTEGAGVREQEEDSLERECSHLLMSLKIFAFIWLLVIILCECDLNVIDLLSLYSNC